MNFSEKLIRLRKREGISQEELASYLEVSRQAVSRWEQGTALPDAGNLLKLRQRFGVSLDWLLEDSPRLGKPDRRRSDCRRRRRSRTVAKAAEERPAMGYPAGSVRASACCCLEFSRRYSRRNIWSRPQ